MPLILEQKFIVFLNIFFENWILIFSILFLRSEENGSLLPGNRPLLVPCLTGLGKFSHLIDMDFMGDLMNCLRKLACGSSNSDGSSHKLLTVSERLQCCIIASKVMRNNLDALNVDLHEFFIQLYNLIIEYRPGRLVSDIPSLNRYKVNTHAILFTARNCSLSSLPYTIP